MTCFSYVAFKYFMTAWFLDKKKNNYSSSPENKRKKKFILIPFTNNLFLKI